MKYQYKHRAFPVIIIIDADRPEDAETFLVRVVRSQETWSKV